MEMFQQAISWFSKQKLGGKVAIGCVSLVMLCCLCSIPIAILSPSKPATEAPTPTPVPEFLHTDVVQNRNEKGWTSTQYSKYLETIKGKQVTGWSGKILEINEWGGETYLSLDMKDGEPLIDAYVYISDDDILRVGLGQNVTFDGTIDSDWNEPNDFYSLQIKNVKLIKFGEIPTSTPIPTLELTPTLEFTPTSEITPTSEVTPTLESTPTLEPTPTIQLAPTQNVSDAYRTLASVKISYYLLAFLDSYKFVEDASNDTSLTDDSTWKTNLNISFRILNSRADELAKLEPSPKYVKYHSIIVKLVNETHLFTDAYAKGIDNRDGALIEEARQHIVKINTLMQESNAEWDKIKANP